MATKDVLHLALNPGSLSLEQIQACIESPLNITVDEKAWQDVQASHDFLLKMVASNQTFYGVNTGFGKFANKRIEDDELLVLQENILLSHAVGVGERLSNELVRLVLLLKINSLAQGYSGVSRALIERMCLFLNEQVYPVVPGKGSVGASGDLAPLAHLSLPLIGQGQVYYQGNLIDAKTLHEKLNISPLKLGPKEGLALINGTQVSTALALEPLLMSHRFFEASLLIGGLSIEAIKGDVSPFSPQLQMVRRHQGQQAVAKTMLEILHDSPLRHDLKEFERVQDPYSYRCQPQVMGSVLDGLKHIGITLLNEANAVTDNPLVFAKDEKILSGGNFHAEPVALCADQLAVLLTEMASMSERRTAVLLETEFTGLPPFLIENGGTNSGFMLAHVTSAALVSDNKGHSFPFSVDTIPTSAGQEDHVSMATNAARRLATMCENTVNVLAIEYMAAAQAVDFLTPLGVSPICEQVKKTLRKEVDFIKHDVFLAPLIEKAKNIIESGEISLDKFANLTPLPLL